MTIAEWYAVADEGDRRFRGELRRRSVQVKEKIWGQRIHGRFEALPTRNVLDVNYRNKK